MEGLKSRKVFLFQPIMTLYTQRWKYIDLLKRCICSDVLDGTTEVRPGKAGGQGHSGGAGEGVYFILYRPALSAHHALNRRLQHEDGARKTPQPAQHSINVINIPSKQIVHKIPV